MTLVSIVIPVFNVERYLDECVASVVQQSHTELEILLIDDGSTDGSLARASEWSVADPRVKVLTQPNQGSSVARNAGIASAVGDYLTFVDSDDVIDPRMVERMLGHARQAAADIVVLDIVEFDAEPPVFVLSDHALAGSADEILRQIVCVKPRWGTPAKLYRRSLFGSGTRFAPGILHQDMHLAPRIFAQATKAVISGDRLYGYRQRRGSVMDMTRTVGIKPELALVHQENLEFARLRLGEGPEFGEYLETYCLQLSGHLERLPLGATWRNSGDFLVRYQGFVTRYWPEFSRRPGISLPYKALWWLSGRSPRAFRMAMGLARSLKRSLLPKLRRRSGATNPAD